MNSSNPALPRESALHISTPRRVRVVMRKRTAAAKQLTTPEKSHSQTLSLKADFSNATNKLIDYKNRSVQNRMLTTGEDCSRRRQRSSVSRSTTVEKPSSFKSVGFHEDSTVTYRKAKHSLGAKDLQAAFYSSEEIEKMMNKNLRLANRSTSSAGSLCSSHRVEGLQGFKECSVNDLSSPVKAHKTQYIKAVLDEQRRQRQGGYSCPEDIRRQARTASRPSRALAVQIGKKDAEQAQLLTSNSKGKPRSTPDARVRSKSICGPSAASLLTAAAVKSPSSVHASAIDRRSRRSNSMRISARTATVVMWIFDIGMWCWFKIDWSAYNGSRAWDKECSRASCIMVEVFTIRCYGTVM